MKFRDFSEKLIYWYKGNYRKLPWRNINDPYRIWLSEIILQQTRVAQGLPYYLKFEKHYPTIEDLATAPDDEVMRLWQGLGYYSRARNLLKCARKVVKEYRGQFPESYTELLKLPGIGKYTAAAIASFAFREKVAVVDGNVYRVLSRLFGIDKDISDNNALEHFKSFSEKLISDKHPDLYNQALMEYGATICTPKNPACLTCTFNNLCYAYEQKAQLMLPVKTRKVKVKDRKFTYVAIYNELGCLLKKRGSNDIWAEMYDFLWLESEKQDEIHRVLKNDLNLLKEPNEAYMAEQRKHVLSHQKLQADFILFRHDDIPLHISWKGQDMKFYTWDEVEKLPKPVLVTELLKSQNLLN